MEVTILVKKIATAQKKTGGNYQEIIDEKGQTHRNFDPDADAWFTSQLSKYITLTKEKAKKGNYWDIVGYKEFVGVPPQVEETSSPSFTSDPVKNASIEGQVACMDIGLDLRSGIVDVPKDVLECYWGWCKAKLTRVSPPVSQASGVEEPPAIKKAPSSPASPKDKATKASKEEPKSIRDGTGPATQPQIDRVIELTKLLPGRASILIKEEGWKVEKAVELTRDQAIKLIDKMEEEYKVLDTTQKESEEG